MGHVGGHPLARLAIASVAVLVIAASGVAAAHHHDLGDPGEHLDHVCFVCETTSHLDLAGATVVAPAATPAIAFRPSPAPPRLAFRAACRTDAARAPPALPTR